MNVMSPKTRYIVLPAIEDDIILLSFVLTQYWRVMDRQTDRNALQHAVKCDVYCLLRNVAIVFATQCKVWTYV